MALKPCLECKKEVSTEAKTCPNCGKQAPHKKKGGFWGWILFLLLLASTLTALSVSSPNEPQKPTGPDLGFISSREAKTLCQEKIIAMAVFPSSVDFPFMGWEAGRDPKGNVIVNIDFTAQNRLGAKLPHRGICQINKNGKVTVRIGRR